MNQNDQDGSGIKWDAVITLQHLLKPLSWNLSPPQCPNSDISTWGKCWLCQAHFRPRNSLRVAVLRAFSDDGNQRGVQILGHTQAAVNGAGTFKYITYISLIIFVHRSTSLQFTANLNSYDFRTSTEWPHPDCRSGRSGQWTTGEGKSDVLKFQTPVM